MTKMQKILATIEYAVVKHHGQMRSGTKKPYIVHPLEVAQILNEHGHSHLDILQGAILHDVLEDTDATSGELTVLFGGRVAALVLEVTDNPELSKKEQRLALMQTIPGMSGPARLIKIADGISNVRNTNDNQPEGWTRSLKFAYVKTCEKVGRECVETWWVKQGVSVPCIYSSTFTKEVELAKERLSKAKYEGRGV